MSIWFVFVCGICGETFRAEEPPFVVADGLRHIREKHEALYNYNKHILDVVLAAVKRESGPGD